MAVWYSVYKMNSTRARLRYQNHSSFPNILYLHLIIYASTSPSQAQARPYHQCATGTAVEEDQERATTSCMYNRCHVQSLANLSTIQDNSVESLVALYSATPEQDSVVKPTLFNGEGTKTSLILTFTDDDGQIGEGKSCCSRKHRSSSLICVLFSPTYTSAVYLGHRYHLFRVIRF